uniref:Uncharacterized protein n=1 Tax=Timema cristinae TaxID=61476 RepID=A0A7R9DEA7_TIMCR|nr:unnamed protein product [Timema cristinae]
MLVDRCIDHNTTGPVTSGDGETRFMTLWLATRKKSADNNGGSRARCQIVGETKEASVTLTASRHRFQRHTHYTGLAGPLPVSLVENQELSAPGRSAVALLRISKLTEAPI